MNNNVLEIVLPLSVETVSIKPWLTTGQSRELQKILLSKGDININDTKESKINPITFFEMQDRGAELLIQEIKQKDGTATTFSQDWLNNLHMTDGNLVYEKINEIINLSNLSEEGKKK